MKVEVYKCRFTGTIFELSEKKKYIKHLKKVREDMQKDREYERIRQTFKEWLANEKSKIYRVADIPEWFLDNQQTIMDAANAIDGYFTWSTDKFKKEDKFTKLIFEGMRFSPSVSNSHVCPDNGVTNWCGKDPARPNGYPGWIGNLSGTLYRLPRNKSSYPYSGALNIIGLKTGSGGGGNDNFGYGVSIFLEDWPSLGQELVFETLKGS